MIPAMNLGLLPTAAAQPENRDIPTQQEALRRTVIFLDIDDGFRKEFEELFPEQFVRTWFRLEADNEQRARQILSGLPAQPNRECPPPIGPLPPGLFGG